MILKWLPPTGDSALHRSRNPRSWWWTPEIDFMARQVHVLEGANWQRARSKKNPPTPIARPKEVNTTGPASTEDQRARKKRFLERRKAVS